MKKSLFRTSCENPVLFNVPDDTECFSFFAWRYKSNTYYTNRHRYLLRSRVVLVELVINTNDHPMHTALNNLFINLPVGFEKRYATVVGLAGYCCTIKRFGKGCIDRLLATVAIYFAAL